MKAFDNEPVFKKTTLENGVRIITEHHKNTRATSVGFFVDTGTRDEPANMIGAAHFLEHFLFKGTSKRSAYDIVAELEAIGGEINAYTTKEYTCFHATTLREFQHISIDVLSDLLSNALFDQAEFEKERKVIEQEIDMTAEVYDEYIFDLYFEKAYAGHKLERPILGTKETLGQMSADQIKDFYEQRYCGKNLIVAIAGDVDHDSVVEQLKPRLDLSKSKWEKPDLIKPQVKTFKDFVEKSSEQVHLLMSFPASTYQDSTRYEAYIANAVLGGSMTSRLYQQIREEKGLAYSVYSYLHHFIDSGLLMVYAGVSEENLKETYNLIREQVALLEKTPLEQKELDFYKTQVVGNIVMGCDDIENRMNSIALNEMIFGKYVPLDETIKRVEGITVDSLANYWKEFPAGEENTGLLVLGESGNEILDT